MGDGQKIIDGLQDAVAGNLGRVYISGQLWCKVEGPMLEIADERQRQIAVEGFDASHDDDHGTGQLATAAACYALPPGIRLFDQQGTPANWPWERQWWKPGSYRRDLVKAGALILAEIERIDRDTPIF